MATRFRLGPAVVVSVLLFLGIWEIVSYSGLFDQLLLPGPLPVLDAFWKLFYTGEIIPDLTGTLAKLAAALTVGSIAGFSIGVVLSNWDFAYDVVSPMQDFFRSLPALAMFPLFLIIFGAGDLTNTLLATWICALYMSLHVSEGLRATSETSLSMARSLKKSEFEILFKVRLMEALPAIFLGLRTLASISILVLIGTEMFVGTRSGLGRVLIDSAYTYDTPKLYAVLLILGIIGRLLNYAVLKLEKRVVHWRAA